MCDSYTSLTCGKEFKFFLSCCTPGSPRRVSPLTNSAQDDKTEEKSIQKAPVWLQYTNQEGGEKEKKGKGKHREEDGVDESGLGVRQTPVPVQVVHRSMGDSEEKSGE